MVVVVSLLATMVKEIILHMRGVKIVANCKQRKHLTLVVVDISCVIGRSESYE